MASGDTATYPKFLEIGSISTIASDLKKRGDEATVSPHDARALVNCYITWRDRVRAFLKVLSNEAKCRSCGATIYWVMTKNNKRAPYSVDGISHFADCPNASSHRGASG